MFRTYYHLAKPERTYANLFTGVAGFLLASRWHIHWPLFLGFVCGLALVIASAGVVNNYTDRGLDEVMQRTKKRALVTGQISAQAATIYATLLALIGFGLLIHYVSWLVVWLGVIAYVDYVVLYALSKRTTPYSTWIGTISGAMSLIAGYAAVTGHLDREALLLFLTMVAWQMPHFYAIAIYRAKDYQAAKVPVWPLAYGVGATRRQIQVLIIAFILAADSLTIWSQRGVTFTVIMTAIGLYWFRLSLLPYPQKGGAEAWARKVFLFSLVVIMVFPVILALSVWLP